LVVTSGVVGYLFASSAIYFLALIAFLGSVKILRSWDFNSSSAEQYRNEKLLYLLNTVLFFTMFFKMLLFVFLLYLIDSLTPYIKAAMCGVGVLNGSVLGWELMYLKIILLLLFGAWIVVEQKEREHTDYRFVRAKLKLFLFIFALMSLELLLDFVAIFSLDTQKVVSCCSVSFSNKNEIAGLFSLSIKNSALMYGISLSTLIFISALSLKKGGLGILLTIIWILHLFVSLIFVVYALSPYVYELPTHTCPFCIIQKEYGFIGYLFYILLFAGVFYGIKGGITERLLGGGWKNELYKALISHAIFLAFSLYFIIGYYFKNGVWL